jgi:hypothetical protein
MISKIQNLGSFFLVLALRGSSEEVYTLNKEPVCGILYRRLEEIVQGCSSSAASKLSNCYFEGCMFNG